MPLLRARSGRRGSLALTGVGGGATSPTSLGALQLGANPNAFVQLGSNPNAYVLNAGSIAIPVMPTAWWDASHGRFSDTGATTPLAGNGTCKAWVDRAGGIVSSSSVGLTYSGTGFNGGPGMSCDGATQYLTAPSGLTFNLDNFSYLCVFQPSDVSSNRAPFGGGGASYFDPLGIDSGFWQSIFYTGGDIIFSGYPGITADYANGQFQAAHLWSSNGTNIVGAYGNKAPLTFSQAISSAVISGGIIGALANSTDYWLGTLRHILIYSPALTPTQLSSMWMWAQAQAYPPPPSNYALVIDGNSISAGVGVASPSSQNSWPGQLAALATGWSIYVPAHIGQQTPQCTANASVTVDPYYASGQTHSASLLMEITNDELSNSSSGATLYANVEAYGNARKTFAPNRKVIIVDCLPSTSFSGGQTTNITACNTLLAADFAGTTGNSYVFTGSPGYADILVRVSQIPNLQTPSNATYYADGLHPTTAGAALIAAAVNYALTLV